MKYSKPLDSATLIRRYKRFLADVRVPDGSVMTIHCPNTGSMKNCATSGDEVWYSTSGKPGRKYPHTWELTRTGSGHYIGINTSRANGLVREAIERGAIPELAGYPEIRPEVKYGRENSRIDLHLSGHPLEPDCFVEVKSVTLLESPIRAGIGYFPDAVSERGQKHLRELADVAAGGERAVLCFCVQHSGVRKVRPAGHIDPDYALALTAAIEAGVEVLAYKARLSPRGLLLNRSIEFELS